MSDRQQGDMTDRGVMRGDHNPQGAEAAARGESLGTERNDESAGQKAHGTHGRGVLGQEEKVDPADPRPDFTGGSDRGGAAGWGSEASGGSTIDKRSPDR